MIANENDALVLTNAYMLRNQLLHIYGSNGQAWRFLHNLKARLK